MGIIESLKVLFAPRADRAEVVIPKGQEYLIFFDGFDPEPGSRPGDRSFSFVSCGERLPAVTDNPAVIRALEQMKRGAPMELLAHSAEGRYVTRIDAIKPLKLETAVSPRPRAPAST